jgi:hypothetical protein
VTSPLGSVFEDTALGRHILHNINTPARSLTTYILDLFVSLAIQCGAIVTLFHDSDGGN